MKKCENRKCSKKHDGNYGSGRFCSRICANSREFSNKSKKLKSVKNKEKYNRDGAWGGNIDGYDGLSKKQRQEIARKVVETSIKKLLAKEFTDIKDSQSRRKRIIIEQQGECSSCGLSEWMGKKIILEIDHINGDNQDNSRKNLTGMCPNCHSLTTTWRGRNKTSNKVSDKEVYDAYISEGNVRQALLKVGLAAKGNNYVRVRRIIERYEIDKMTSNSCQSLYTH